MEADTGQLATKADMEALRTDMRTEISGIRTEIEVLRGDVKTLHWMGRVLLTAGLGTWLAIAITLSSEQPYRALVEGRRRRSSSVSKGFVIRKLCEAGENDADI